MNPSDVSAERRWLLVLPVLCWVASGVAWALVERSGHASTLLRIAFGLNGLLLPAMALITWRRLRTPVPADADTLDRLANTDGLTMLANRRRLARALEYERVRFARYGHVFSIILFDIDGFRAVNDRFGRDTGDRTLVALADRTAELLRDVDLFGRWGADAFIVVLPETGYEETLPKAEALCRHVAAAPLVDGHPVTISCGVACVEVGDTAEMLLERAEYALQAARHQGRNRAMGRPAPAAVARMEAVAA